MGKETRDDVEEMWDEMIYWIKDIIVPAVIVAAIIVYVLNRLF